ncbi:head protein [Pantoea sp. VS1]|uniref:Mu-like prophage major head subunit gpT family protein n=1 Tax=Pantoea sp. VS1 TaxID=2003658 RepID=UPI000B4FEE03|nr:Mu-like prophage major head subunit gpT family protein [Pantoea sp. VS1]OWS76301.1 head protein [Pantoea sp. VS1]
MLVNKQNLRTIFVGLKSTFQNAFNQTPTDWTQIAMVVPSSTKEENYAWLSRFPKMREWLGEKVVKQLEGFSYTIRNKDWEATIEVDRNDIEDDTMLGYAQQAQGAGQSAAELPADIIGRLLSGGFTSLCYDGQYFFDTDHPVGKGVQSNKSTKKLAVTSLAAAQAGYGAARAAMRNFKDNEGENLRIQPGLLVVPPALEDVANYLMTADRFPDNTPNTYKGTAKVLVWPGLATDTEWYLFDVSKPVKPIVYQERKKPVFVEQTDMDSDQVFLNKKFKFGAEARSNGGYGFWQMAFGSTGVDA